MQLLKMYPQNITIGSPSSQPLTIRTARLSGARTYTGKMAMRVKSYRDNEREDILGDLPLNASKTTCWCIKDDFLRNLQPQVPQLHTFRLTLPCSLSFDPSSL